MTAFVVGFHTHQSGWALGYQTSHFLDGQMLFWEYFSFIPFKESLIRELIGKIGAPGGRYAQRCDVDVFKPNIATQSI